MLKARCLDYTLIFLDCVKPDGQIRVISIVVILGLSIQGARSIREELQSRPPGIPVQKSKNSPPPPYEIPENSRFPWRVSRGPQWPKHCRNAAF